MPTHGRGIPKISQGWSRVIQSMPNKQINGESEQATRRKAVQRIRQFYGEKPQLEKRWEDNSYVYSLRNPAGFYTHWRLQQSFVRLLNKNDIVLSNKKMLDIGCGTGGWLRFFSELRGSSSGLIGCDIVSHRIEKARAVNPGMEFILGDAAALPFNDSSFDIVTQFDTFEHFLDEETLTKASSEVSRVLKDSGLLIWFDLLPFALGSDPINRGFSLKQIESLFPEFELLYKEPLFGRFSLGAKSVSTVYLISRFAFMPRFAVSLAELVESLPCTRGSNILVLMVKGARR